MSKLLRYFEPGQLCFITTATYQRRPILVEHSDLWEQAISRVSERVRFEILAWVILPDHVHFIVEDVGESPSKLVKRLKLSFANLYFELHGTRRGTVWQRRFWDHVIRDQEDLNRHIDYIHYNPVKHGWASDPFEWPHSSLGRFFDDGYYARDWGVQGRIDVDGEFGE